jgi:hypothetical protein
LCSHITADDLPKTFREAIATAKKFGISYLWIDSFCIIQDSHSDWLAEAATMEAVYSNSALNIMATASRGVEDGLFRTHGGVTVTPCVVRAAWDDMQPETFVLGSHKTWIDLALKTPLHARGWVLQERILPPRALHFGHDQLIWECRGQDACEAFPQGIPTVLCQTTYHRVKVTEVVDFRAWLAVKDPDRLLSDQDLGFELWDRIISWYASTQLTNQSDMLVAISGLAKRFQRILNDRYLAGLWAKKLEKHLLWRPGPDSAGRPVIPSAPTWSWASMKCGFSFDPHSMYGHDGIKCIEVENVNVNTVDPNDDTGPVLDGYIRLRGHPIFAEFYRIPRFDEFPQLCFDKGRTRGNCHLDDRNDVKAILSCVFLPVNQGIIAGVGQKVSGLILQSKPTRQGWYCRKGVATVWRDPSGDYETGWKNLVQRLEGVTKTDGTLCLESSPGTIMLM